MNLKLETLHALKLRGLSVDDIEWIGTREYTIPFDRELSVLDVEYDDGFGSQDDGFGAQEIAMDFIIVGKDFWLERRIIAGCELWEFKRLPIKPNEVRDYTKVDEGFFSTLLEINEICDRCSNTLVNCECEYELSEG